MSLYHYTFGQTPIDEEEKQGLIPILFTREQLNAFEQDNIEEARRWAMRKTTLRRSDVLTESFLLRLHKRMYQHVWTWAGTLRTSNKNIGVPFYQVPIELRSLLDDARYWLEHSTYTHTELAVIFHHRLVKIHLFPNGNGRHARLCADIMIAQYGASPLTWGGTVDLGEESTIRKRYISALRKADEGDYEALLAFAVA